MKRLMQWVMAAILICGATLFTSCMNEDNPVDPATNLSEMIIGKWIVADLKGKPAPTNVKMVTTFISTTKAIASSSKVDFTEKDSKWNVYREDDVVIAGNKVTLTGYVDGVETVNTEYDIRLVKVTTDYRTAIVGTWEGHCTSEGSEFDDGQEHRWQYNADGTYVYYVKDGDNWVSYEGTTLSEYFVDGSLLCTRWIDQGQENREWWEISIDGDKMNWTALRQKEDGITFTATFEMKKVE